MSITDEGKGEDEGVEDEGIIANEVILSQIDSSYIVYHHSIRPM